MRKLVFLAGLFSVLGLGLWFFWRRQTVLGARIIVPIFAPDTIFSLASRLNRAGIFPEAPLAMSGSTIMASISGRRVLFENNSSLNDQIRTLQLLLTRLKMEGGATREIDLRFNKVVVR